VSRECRIEIDAEACTGHGRCYELAPNAFDEDERGYGQVGVGVVPPELMVEVCYERGYGQVGVGVVPPELMVEVCSAIANCPESAVRLVFLSGETDAESE